MDPFLKWFVIGLVAASVASAVGMALLVMVDQGTFQDEPTHEASFDHYGQFWPLTVDMGEVDCINQTGERRGISVFRHDEITYALNEAAEQAGYPPIDPIRKDSPKAPELKMSLKPLRDLASTKC